MKLARRKVLRLAAAAVALPAVSRVATAQTYPSRPITMVVTLPAGSAMDAAARLVAERMRQSLGQPIIIENVSGANGSIGTGRIARATPDGYSIVVGIWNTHGGRSTPDSGPGRRPGWLPARAIPGRDPVSNAQPN